MYIKISSQIIRTLPVTVGNREKWQSSQDIANQTRFTGSCFMANLRYTNQTRFKKTDDQWP